MKNLFFLGLALVLTKSTFAAISFELKEMKSGSFYNSGSHAEGIFIVEAYFLGCPYCNQNAQNVNDLAEKYMGENRVQVLDVGVDRDDKAYQTWIERHKPNHPVLKDANRLLIRQLGTTAYPSTYIIDCKGNIIYRTTGVWEPATKRELEQTVDGLLKSGCQNE